MPDCVDTLVIGADSSQLGIDVFILVDYHRVNGDGRVWGNRAFLITNSLISLNFRCGVKGVKGVKESLYSFFSFGA